jgi:hypothetical protein
VYEPGSEVLVFAIRNADGSLQTAELMLGKFEIWTDANGDLFAVPDIARGVHEGVTVQPDAFDGELSLPRPLGEFLAYLAGGASGEFAGRTGPVGFLVPIRHDEVERGPNWGHINNSRYRFSNPTAVWSLDGTANMTGGGSAEAAGALASWTNDPNSTIQFLRRRRHRVRRPADRFRLALLARRDLLQHHERRGLAARLLQSQRLQLRDHGVRPGARGRPRHRAGPFRSERDAERRLPRR